MFLDMDNEPDPLPSAIDASVATVSQVNSALTNLTEQELAILRYAAKSICSRYRELSEQNAHDLLQDAFMAVLERRRLWQPANVEFVPFVIGIMRSLASSYHKHIKGSRSVDITYEHELAPSEEGGTTLDIGIESHNSPEEAVERDQHAALAEAAIAILQAQLAKNSLALEILNGLISGKTKKEIRDSLDVDSTTFWSADRQVVRAIEAYSRSNANG